jgi:phosphatidylserine/phosphatidylglycerophosphate/cardiolipin synthase-like enzyme
VQTVSQTKEKKQSKRGAQKKQDNVHNVRGGAELIDKNCATQAFFTSVHDLADIVISLIAQARKNLCIAAFTLTEPRIANLVIEKHKNGVQVCVIVDAGNMKQAYSKVHELIDNNVPVWRYDPSLDSECKKNGLFEPLMHHKFITIDDDVVVTGSANFTKAAYKQNRDNIIVARDKKLTRDYRAECERLRICSVECKSHNKE